MCHQEDLDLPNLKVNYASILKLVVVRIRECLYVLHCFVMWRASLAAYDAAEYLDSYLLLAPREAWRCPGPGSERESSTCVATAIENVL